MSAHSTRTPRTTFQLLWLSALLCALGFYPVARRIQFDRANVRLECIADLRGFREVARVAAKDDRTLLSDLARAGVSAAAIRPCSTDQLAAESVLQLAGGAAAGHTRIKVSFPDRYSIGASCAELFSGTTVAGDIVDVPVAGELFRSTPMFFDHELIRQVHAAGLELVWRLPNEPWAGPPFLKYLIWKVPEGSTVVFDEESALGWPANIGLVAEAFEARKLRVGDVEFSGQEGVPELLAARPLSTVFIHSIPPRELAKLPYSRLLPRWKRAADERNIRMFYLHPLPATRIQVPGTTLYGANMDYLHDLRAELARAGYSKGVPMAAAPFLEVAAAGRKGRLSRAAAAGGAAALVTALATLFRILPEFIFALLFLPLAALLAFSPKAAALAAAVSAPALSAVLFERRTRHGPGTLRIACELGGVLALNCLGGTLVYELLSDPAYVLHRAAFSGVKLVYVLPILLAAFELVRRDRIPLFSTRVSAADLALLAAVALAGAVYVARSGNFSPVAATEAEQSLRDRMEEKLPARPRTKEFACGYPALVLLAFLGSTAGHRVSWRARLALLAAGTIAPVSISNAFCHLHTPYALTLTRGAMGLAAGWLLLLVLRPFARAVSLAAGGPYASVSGYFGHENCGDDWILAIQLEALREASGNTLVPLVFTGAPRAALPQGVRSAWRLAPHELAVGLAVSRVHISSGGGLFQDASGPFSVPYYTALLALHRAASGGYQAMAGQSFSSLSRASYRCLVAWFALGADFVQARDEASAGNLRRWVEEDLGEAPPPGWPDRGTDLLFWRPLPPPRTQKSRKLIGVNLRPVRGVPASVLEAIASACRAEAAARGLEVRFLAFQERQDGRVMTAFASPSELVRVTPASAYALFDECAAIVAMRYHAMLLAACAGVPLAALSYDEKTDFFLAQSDCSARVERSALASARTAAGEARSALARVLDSPEQGERLRAWAEGESRRGLAARNRFVESVKRSLSDE